jgi:hypothetical protein
MSTLQASFFRSPRVVSRRRSSVRARKIAREVVGYGVLIGLLAAGIALRALHFIPQF